MTQDDWKKGYSLSAITHYDADDHTLSQVINRVLRVIYEHPFILKDCPRILNEETADTTCKYYINAPIFMDCSLIANFFGPFSTEEISVLMETDTKEIQKLLASGMKKLKERLDKGEVL